MLVVILRAIILYVLITFCIRLMGKRQLGQLSPSELVVTIMLSNIATIPIQDLNLSMLMGVVPILTLVCLDVIISAVTLKSKTFRRWVSGTSKVIIKDGIINQKVLKDLRLSIDDLMESLRSSDVFDISEVQYAIVETTGSINVYQKAPHQTATAQMVGAKYKIKNPPQLIIDDGIIIEHALKSIKLSHSWLKEFLLAKEILASDVFILTADESGKTNIILKDNI